MLHRAITDEIIGGCYETYNAFGPGYSEQTYHRGLVIVLKARGLIVESEVPLRMTFRGEYIADFRLDLLVQYAVIVECKAEARIHPSHRRQLRQYLAATGVEVGLLLNFGPEPSLARMYVSADGRESRELQFHRRGVTGHASLSVSNLPDPSNPPDP